MVSVLDKLREQINKELQSNEKETSRLENRSFSPEILWLLGTVRKILLKKHKDEEHEKKVASLIMCKSRPSPSDLLMENIARALSKGIKDLIPYLPADRRVLKPNEQIVFGVMEENKTQDKETWKSYTLKPKSSVKLVGELVFKFLKSTPTADA